MAVQGKKINELTAIGTVSDETVLPAVYVSGTTVNSTANKISVEQISNKVQSDMSETLAGKQDVLTAGANITINDNTISATVPEGVLTETNVHAGDGISIEQDSDEGITISANVPSNVWTQDNLVAGTNISLAKQINPNVITSDTLAVFHFDGNFNFINGADKQEHPISDIGSTSNATTSTNQYKFGTAGAQGASSNPYGTIVSTQKATNPLNNSSYILSFEKSFTLDFWWYPPTGSASGIGLGKDKQKLQLEKSQAYDNILWFRATDANGSPKYIQTSASVLTANAWNHIAITHDASGSTGVAKLYVNGTKVGSDLTGIVKAASYGNDRFDTIDVGYNNAYIDELRISKGIIWDGNFTPPAQPYAISPTGDTYEINNTLNYVAGENISITEDSDENLVISSTVSVPNNIWTQDNLVAGNNISITRQIDPNIADASKTLALYHFDTNKSNSSSNTLGLYYSEQNSYAIETSFYKFGPGCCHFYDAYGIKSDTEQTFTTAKSVDYWFKVSCHSVSEEDLFRFGSAIYLRAINTINQAGNDYNHDHFTLNGVSFNNALMAQAFYDNQWHHLACTLSTTKFVLFIDGTKVVDQDRTGSFSTIYNYNRNWLFEAWMPSKYNSYIDEFRLTDDDLYSQLDSFTPPTTPYVLSTEPQDTYQIDANVSLDQPINAITETSGTIALETNKVYKATITGNTTFTLPATVDNTKFNQIYIQLDVAGGSDDSDEPIIDLGTTNYFGDEPVITSGLSWVNYEYNAIEQAWYVGKIGPNGSGGSSSGANTSLSNLTDAGKIQAAHLAMPSDKYDVLTVSVGQWYTAPADGYLGVFGDNDNGTNVYVWVVVYGSDTTTPPPSSAWNVVASCVQGPNNGKVRTCLPVAKGQHFSIVNTNAAISAGGLVVLFTYAQGSESEQEESN